MRGAGVSSGAVTPPRQRQTARCRKQKLQSTLSDSGFEEDLASPQIPCRPGSDVSHLESNEPEPAGRLSTWFLQYGDVGFKIQKVKEAHFHPCQSLARQPQLTAEARCKLVSWLIPVHQHFHLSFECCCLTVNIMDRFLASTPVAADCFQLLGVTALLLASKQVEVCSPSVSHLLSLCCDAFTKEQLCNLECLILLRLNFRLAAPTLAFFLDCFINCVEDAHLMTESDSSDMFLTVKPGMARTRQCSNLAQKVCELTLADYAFNKYPPSLTANCALGLAGELLKTEHGYAEDTNKHSPGNQCESFRDDLSISINPSENRECSDEDSCAANDLSIGEENEFNYNLLQECKDKLKLLVSLNRETLTLVCSM
ncbi:cyclin-O [Cololabis saira]|uniref:cyclin-O n=1 Tax=Cololabis saira TaxID=129043 RepID=UPI002AD24B3D|nr:cyclin-O [Cololabis saira]